MPEPLDGIELDDLISILGEHIDSLRIHLYSGAPEKLKDRRVYLAYLIGIKFKLNHMRKEALDDPAS